MFDIHILLPNLFSCIKFRPKPKKDLIKSIQRQLENIQNSSNKQKITLILNELMEYTDSQIGVINEFRDGLQFNVVSVNMDLNENLEFHIRIYPIRKNNT